MHDCACWSDQLGRDRGGAQDSHARWGCEWDIVKASLDDKEMCNDSLQHIKLDQNLVHIFLDNVEMCNDSLQHINP